MIEGPAWQALLKMIYLIKLTIERKIYNETKSKHD